MMRVVMVLMAALVCACATHRPVAVELDPERNARFEAATRYSARFTGQAVLVMEGDTIIWERYRRGLRPGEPKQIYSGTKSFLCAAAVAAQDDGLLDLDAPAALLLDEWRDDPTKAAITGRQLLQQVSGLETVFPDAAAAALFPFFRIADQQAWALAQPVAAAPGERYEYGCVHMLAFAALLERAVGEPVLDYLERRIFAPIGIEHGRWLRDPAGHALFSVGAPISARDRAPVGQHLRDATAGATGPSPGTGPASGSSSGTTGWSPGGACWSLEGCPPAGRARTPTPPTAWPCGSTSPWVRRWSPGCPAPSPASTPSAPCFPAGPRTWWRRWAGAATACTSSRRGIW